ncbi:MAG: hypothetical protein U1F68_00615 [Gammaproteobacteria bacterium]
MALYYRKSARSPIPEHQAAFKKQFGYDLPVPPEIPAAADISKYFNGKNWDSHDGDPDSGTVLHLAGERRHYHFQSLSASFAIAVPGDKVDQFHNVYWFDPTNMKPLINSPGHVKALEFLAVRTHKNRPAAQVGWSLAKLGIISRGKAVFVFSWGDVVLCQDKARSKIAGRLLGGDAAGLTNTMIRKRNLRKDRRSATGGNTTAVVAWRHLEFLRQS